MSTADVCQTLSMTESGAAGAETLPDTAAAIWAACSGEMDIRANAMTPTLFGTPLSVYFSGRTPETNPVRKLLYLTSSAYPDALNVKGCYSGSRAKFARVKYYGEKPPAPDPFGQQLMDDGRRMEPFIFDLWQQLHPHLIAVPSGLLLDQLRPDLFGGTPDGLVFDRYTYELVGTLELKYRPIAKQLSTDVSLIPDKYWIQMVGQLMCLPVHRWFYMEYRDDDTYYHYTDTITEGTKTTLRSDLLAFVELVKGSTLDSFPKRCRRYDMDKY